MASVAWCSRASDSRRMHARRSQHGPDGVPCLVPPHAHGVVTAIHVLSVSSVGIVVGSAIAEPALRGGNNVSVGHTHKLKKQPCARRAINFAQCEPAPQGM